MVLSTAAVSCGSQSVLSTMGKDQIKRPLALVYIRFPGQKVLITPNRTVKMENIFYYVIRFVPISKM
jgi:hypothetical protein